MVFSVETVFLLISMILGNVYNLHTLKRKCLFIQSLSVTDLDTRVSLVAHLHQWDSRLFYFILCFENCNADHTVHIIENAVSKGKKSGRKEDRLKNCHLQ